MGRRTSNPENVKKEEINETVVENKEVSTSKADVKAEARKKAREKRKLFTNDLEIAMFCNVSNAEFVYEDTRNNKFLEMFFGDVEVFTFKELKEMRNAHRGVLSKYMLIPYDVYSDELTLEDVTKELGIDKYYDEDMLYAESIDELLLEVNYSYFKKCIDSFVEAKKINGNKERYNYIDRIIDRALELTRDGQFNDSNKQLYLRKIVGNLDSEYNIFENAFMQGQEV